jgi:hypothetical protein
VHMAREDLAPPGVPFKLPEIEPVDSTSRSSRGRASRPPERGAAVSEAQADWLASPAGDPAGVQLWLSLPAGGTTLPLDAETRARLRALGYL